MLRLASTLYSYSFHGLQHGGAMAVYQEGLDQVDIKQHGLWMSDSLWTYVTSPCLSNSALAWGLVSVMGATSGLNINFVLVQWIEPPPRTVSSTSVSVPPLHGLSHPLYCLRLYFTHVTMFLHRLQLWTLLTTLHLLSCIYIHLLTK